MFLCGRQILENFTAHKNDGSNSITMPRSEYLQQLTDDMAGYYGYLPYLIEKFLGLFSPSQTVEFLEANEVDRPVTIRTNTLRSRRKDLQQALQGRGMRVEPIDKWSSVGMVRPAPPNALPPAARQTPRLLCAAEMALLHSRSSTSPPSRSEPRQSTWPGTTLSSRPPPSCRAWH